MPKVTAICPTRQRHKWIPLAIECFLSQTFTDSELLIVEDGPDSCMTPELQANLIERVRYIHLPPYNSGNWRQFRQTGLMRNICCENARGEIIVHWDDDDWSAPNRIESQLAFMEKTGKPFVGYHAITFWDTNYRGPVESAGFLYIGTEPYAAGTSQCYLRSYWEKHKFVDRQSIGEDSDFSAYAKGRGELASQDGRQMIVARAHSDSTSPPQLRSIQFPRAKFEDIPEGFLRAIGVKK